MTDLSRSAAPTSAQLKNDIDSGRTGDKVAFPDPGMSPLGTDDEAAGAGPTAMQIAQARKTETTRPVETTQPTSKVPLIAIGVVVLCALIIAAAWFGLRT